MATSGAEFVQQLPQLEALCERLYNSQVGRRAWRSGERAWGRPSF